MLNKHPNIWSLHGLLRKHYCIKCFLQKDFTTLLTVEALLNSARRWRYWHLLTYYQHDKLLYFTQLFFTSKYVYPLQLWYYYVDLLKAINLVSSFQSCRYLYISTRVQIFRISVYLIEYKRTVCICSSRQSKLILYFRDFLKCSLFAWCTCNIQ